MRISESSLRGIIREELKRNLSEGFVDSIKGFFKGAPPTGDTKTSGLSSLITETDGMRLFGISPDALTLAVGSRSATLIGDTGPARLFLALGNEKVTFSIMGSESESMPARLRANFSGAGRGLELMPPERKRGDHPSGFSGSVRIDTPRETQLDPKLESTVIKRLGFDFDAWVSYTSNLGPRRKFDELQKLCVVRGAVEAIQIAHRRVLDCFEAPLARELFRQKLR